jgi:hypothetical protein
MKTTIYYIAVLTLIFNLKPSVGRSNALAEFFIVWGNSGQWNCSLTIEQGQFNVVQPYMFLGKNDRIDKTELHQVSCTTNSDGGVDGLHLFAVAGDNTPIKFSSNRISREFALSEIPEAGYKVFREGQDFLIIGKGDPGFGPRFEIEKSFVNVFGPPVPQSPVALPEDWRAKDKSIHINLSEKPKGELLVRRCSNNDGKLYLEIYTRGKPLEGKAEIEFNGKLQGKYPVTKSLWLSLKPYIDTLSVVISSPAGVKNLIVATTLVEVRKNQLYVNGEPFLIKGTLPGEMTPEEARYVKSLGMNTLRGGTVVKEAEQYGFMISASIQGGGLKKISDYVKKGDQKEFESNLKEYLANTKKKGMEAINSPNALVIQLDNERTEIGANPLNNEKGADPWSEFLLGDKSEFKILDGILIKNWNQMKPLAPMLPMGYANESPGYIAPSFLDVYMHNTFLEKDRYGIPLKTFAHWQGCENRPFINTEYGANRYTPESFHGAKNSPVLEKLHAWNFKELWKVYLDAGTIGGTIYRLFDGDNSNSISGTLNFGLMTLDHQPKLACWELMHIWRDFEVEPMNGNGNSLLLTYKRDYWARNCKLTIYSDGQEKIFQLEDFSPNSRRVVEVPDKLSSLRWEINYTTHSGLKMLASGAYPQSTEEQDFLKRLEKRETFDFLKELFDAKVMTVDRQKAPPTFAELQQKDGVIPVAFQKPNGVVYITAFARINPDNGYYMKADINTSFTGTLTPVDEWTGKPVNADIQWEQTRTGIRIKSVNIPIIPGPIGQRSNKPVVLPVFKITPFNH